MTSEPMDETTHLQDATTSSSSSLFLHEEQAVISKNTDVTSPLKSIQKSDQTSSSSNPVIHNDVQQHTHPDINNSGISSSIPSSSDILTDPEQGKGNHPDHVNGFDQVHDPSQEIKDAAPGPDHTIPFHSSQENMDSSSKNENPPVPESLILSNPIVSLVSNDDSNVVVKPETVPEQQKQETTHVGQAFHPDTFSSLNEDDEDQEDTMTSGGPVLISMDSDHPCTTNVDNPKEEEEEEYDPDQFDIPHDVGALDEGEPTFGFVIDTNPSHMMTSSNPDEKQPPSPNIQEISHENHVIQEEEEYDPEEPFMIDTTEADDHDGPSNPNTAPLECDIEESIVEEGVSTSFSKQTHEEAHDSLIDSIIAEGMAATSEEKDVNDVPESSLSSTISLEQKTDLSSSTSNIHSSLPDNRPNGGDGGKDFNPNAFHPVHTVHFTTTPSILSKLPDGSRLFIGHIICSRTSKHELASIFAKYGNIVEISLRDHYAFIQYDSPLSCQAAIEHENRRVIGGSDIDLKLAKDNRFSARLKKDEDLQHSHSQLHEGSSRRDNTGGDRAMRGTNAYSNSRDGRGYGRDDRHKPYDRHSGRDDRDRRDNRSDGRYDTKGRYDSSRRTYDDHSRRDDFSRSAYHQSTSRHDGYHSHDRFEHKYQQQFPSSNAPTRMAPSPPDCHVIIMDSVMQGFQTYTIKILRRYDLSVETTQMAPHMNLASTISSIVSRGTFGIVFMEKRFERSSQMALHVFPPGGQSPPQEYTNLQADEVAKILFKEKQSRTALTNPVQPPHSHSSWVQQQQQPGQNPSSAPSFGSGYPSSFPGGQSQLQPNSMYQASNYPQYPGQPQQTSASNAGYPNLNAFPYQQQQQQAPIQPQQPGLDNLALLINQIQQQPGAAGIDPQLLAALGQAAAGSAPSPSNVMPPQSHQPSSFGFGAPQQQQQLPQPHAPYSQVGTYAAPPQHHQSQPPAQLPTGGINPANVAQLLSQLNSNGASFPSSSGFYAPQKR